MRIQKFVPRLKPFRSGAAPFPVGEPEVPDVDAEAERLLNASMVAREVLEAALTDYFVAEGLQYRHFARQTSADLEEVVGEEFSEITDNDVKAAAEETVKDHGSKITSLANNLLDDRLAALWHTAEDEPQAATQGSRLSGERPPVASRRLPPLPRITGRHP